MLLLRFILHFFILVKINTLSSYASFQRCDRFIEMVKYYRPVKILDKGLVRKRNYLEE